MKQVTLKEIEAAYINEFDRLTGGILEYGLHKDGQSYADNHNQLIKLSYEHYGKKYFLAHENSLRPFSVMFENTDWIEKYFGLDCADYNEDRERKNKARRKQINMYVKRRSDAIERYNELGYKYGHDVTPELIERYNELRDKYGFGGPFLIFDREEDREALTKEFKKLSDVVYASGYINQLQFEIDRGNLIVCELVM